MEEKVTERQKSILNRQDLYYFTKVPESIDIILIPLHDNTFVLFLEPGDGIILGNSMLGTDSARLDLSSGDSVSWTDQDNVEVHTENTSGRIVL